MGLGVRVWDLGVQEEGLLTSAREEIHQQLRVLDLGGVWGLGIRV